ncbi:MAG: FecR domain-containing protein [Spirochaetia bacterium]|jgi:hypothetical protein
MKSAIAGAVFLLIGAMALSAVPADVTYTEGDASIRLSNGRQQDAQIGDVMNTGDTLKTGRDGQAELDQKGVTIKIAGNTVFTLMEREQGGKTSSVLAVALGSIKFHYGKITGSEPLVSTNSAVAGARGTDFTVFSGADGSTLIAVDAGEVTVESQGQSVDLAANEGVEVPLGRPPGDKFTVQRNQVDYSAWNEGKLDAMLSDPLAAMTSIETAMAGYEKDVADYDALFKQYRAQLNTERANLVTIINQKGKEEANKYESEVVTPLVVKTTALGLNLRYSSLAALSLRRFVAGRLYVFLKARYITQPSAETWTSFLTHYNELLAGFETSIVPHLVEADI